MDKAYTPRQILAARIVKFIAPVAFPECRDFCPAVGECDRYQNCEECLRDMLAVEGLDWGEAEQIATYTPRHKFTLRIAQLLKDSPFSWCSEFCPQSGKCREGVECARNIRTLLRGKGLELDDLEVVK